MLLFIEMDDLIFSISEQYLGNKANKKICIKSALFMPRNVSKAFYTIQVPIDLDLPLNGSLTLTVPATAYSRTVPDVGTLGL